jgi:hypothetical protein
VTLKGAHYPEEWTDVYGRKRLTCICGHSDPFHGVQQPPACKCTTVMYDPDAGCTAALCISKHREVSNWINKIEPIEDEL